MPLYAVQTTASYEETSAEMITKRGAEGIHSALAPETMTSYIIVEADNRSIVERVLQEVPNTRKVLDKEVSITEVESFLQPTSDVKGITEDAVVRLIDGPFQGEKARVTEIDNSNERVTVELYEATVPIPVDVRGDQLRVLDKEEWDNN